MTATGNDSSSGVKLTPRENEVTIKIRAFPYYVDLEDPVQPGKVIRQERVAVRGDTVKLTDVDYARAQKFEAIVTDADSGVAGDGTTEAMPVAERLETSQLSFYDATVEDVSQWISEKKPTVDRVEEEANNDPALAQKLLDAENHATGQQPRSSLEKKLKEIIEG